MNIIQCFIIILYRNSIRPGIVDFIQIIPIVNVGGWVFPIILSKQTTKISKIV